MPYKNTSIKSIIGHVEKKRMVLPAIQRGFVWKKEQILDLFDSIMKDYPIGSFLLWNVEKESLKNLDFYEILSNHKQGEKQFIKAKLNGNSDIIAVLDGQQRLTAFNIGLKGFFSEKKSSGKQYEDKFLYLNLLSRSDDPIREFDFKLFTEEEAKQRDKYHFWFKVADILKFSENGDVTQFLIEKSLLHTKSQKNKEQSRFANNTLSKLFNIVQDETIINYYEETEQDINKVLNVFIRANTGGTKLIYADLLLSIATAKWERKDARSEITQFTDEINQIGHGYNFDKDYILKGCLMLSDLDVEFEVKNFSRENMLKIEKKWENIKSYLKISIELIESFGYSKENLPQHLPILPIAYYLMVNKKDEKIIDSIKEIENRELIRQWFNASILKLIFSKHSDIALKTNRKVIQQNLGIFPIEGIKKEFKGISKSLVFSDNDINSLLLYQYKKKYTFSTLAIFYPYFDFANIFHIDHIFPKSTFTEKNLKKLKIQDEKIPNYLDIYNNIGNLLILPGQINKEKSKKAFDVWLNDSYKTEDERNSFKKKHFIPDDIDLTINNFDQFIEKRNDLLKSEFKHLLPYFI